MKKIRICDITQRFIDNRHLLEEYEQFKETQYQKYIEIPEDERPDYDEFITYPANALYHKFSICADDLIKEFTTELFTLLSEVIEITNHSVGISSADYNYHSGYLSFRVPFKSEYSDTMEAFTIHLARTICVTFWKEDDISRIQFEERCIPKPRIYLKQTYTAEDIVRVFRTAGIRKLADKFKPALKIEYPDFPRWENEYFLTEMTPKEVVEKYNINSIINSNASIEIPDHVVRSFDLDEHLKRRLRKKYNVILSHYNEVDAFMAMDRIDKGIAKRPKRLKTVFNYRFTLDDLDYFCDEVGNEERDPYEVMNEIIDQ